VILGTKKEKNGQAKQKSTVDLTRWRRQQEKTTTKVKEVSNVPQTPVPSSSAKSTITVSGKKA
jgi:hypothetical protein